jgi:hypothetical protein
LLPTEIAEVPTQLTKPLDATEPEYGGGGGGDDDNKNNKNSNVKPLTQQPTKPLSSKFTNILNKT